MTKTSIRAKILTTAASISLLTTNTCIQSNLPLKAMPLRESSPTLIASKTPEEETRIRLYQKANPAVVAIDLGKGHGSGFIVSPDGLILTNAHVLSDSGGSVKVILADGREVIADVIGFAGENLDLAAAKIRGANNLPTLKLAPPNSVEVGQTVYAIGTPLELELRNSLSVGIVSGIHDRGTLIQHDAAINPGNSGGPLLNSNGEVIGVNQLIATGYVEDADGKVIGSSVGNIGISFAISTQAATPFLVAVLEGNVSQVAQQPQPSSESLSLPILPVNGQVVASKLQSGDPTLPNNSYFHAYAFEGRAGQQVTIEVKSQQIDPSLILVLPEKDSGKVIATNDDISPNNFNSKLQAILPEDGVYVVFTSAFETGETGNYQIRAILR